MSVSAPLFAAQDAHALASAAVEYPTVPQIAQLKQIELALNTVVSQIVANQRAFEALLSNPSARIAEAGEEAQIFALLEQAIIYENEATSLYPKTSNIQTL